MYRTGMAGFKALIQARITALDYLNDPLASDRYEQLSAMDTACDAVIIFARRHADLTLKMAQNETDPRRRQELQTIAAVCRQVPENAPRTFHEALQMYWFVHLGTITELNGWDAMSPGHLDLHLLPFYQKGLADGTLTREAAKELLACLWIKINNHTAPPKVGVTAKESGTYNDFTQINLGGLNRDGSDGANDVSYLALEVADELQLLQPQPSVHISSRTPDRFLETALKVIRKGYGYPSVFNTDMVIQEQIRAGKSVEDAREGGTSGCIETGAFGKEAYILTGYLNVPKILEITLNNGTDPLTDETVGISTGDPHTFARFEDLYTAFVRQLDYIVDLKIQVNNYIERMYARYCPAPFLSVVIDDCIDKGKDYYDGGPRYNTNYIQCCGIGTVTDSLSAIKTHVFDNRTVSWDQLLTALGNDFTDAEPLRLTLWNRTPFFGNDDDRADSIMQQVFQSLFA
ncbi:MAG: formate C-acetyltransferase/glycerol dehydratase family glycyl radical enzyme, partial [Desulfobacteraceae bacterium]|nr:formate C-acetyltransferase/glycerol dehydratase family glycyl radical enzyme [Desulfobacteraceae bacterium]